MGYDVTRQGLGWTLFFFALLLLLFWKHSLAEPVPFDPLSAGDMPLGAVLAGVARRLPVFSGILSALLAFAGGVVLTRIVSRNMILLERTYMPILLYPAVGCSAYFGPESLPALAASFLTIASFDTMLVSFRRTAVSAVCSTRRFWQGRRCWSGLIRLCTCCCCLLRWSYSREAAASGSWPGSECCCPWRFARISSGERDGRFSGPFRDCGKA